jgi:hypothetical protein
MLCGISFLIDGYVLPEPTDIIPVEVQVLTHMQKSDFRFWLGLHTSSLLILLAAHTTVLSVAI